MHSSAMQVTATQILVMLSVHWNAKDPPLCSLDVSFVRSVSLVQQHTISAQ